MYRKTIPKKVKTQVWNEYIGEEKGIGKCNVCADKIWLSSFDCGHIISARDGGEDIVKNLVPICHQCNLSMGTDNLNEFKKKYFSEKSYIDIFVNTFLEKTTEKYKIKGFMGWSEYEYQYFLSVNDIYKKYCDWIYYNHTKYYEEKKLGSYMRNPDKIELEKKCISEFGIIVRDPVNKSEWGFVNITFK